MQFTKITSRRTPAHEGREIVLADLDEVVAAMSLLGQLRDQDRGEVVALAERMVTEITNGTGYSPYAARITGADIIMRNFDVSALSCTGHFFTHNELSNYPPFDGLTLRVHPNDEGFVFRVAERDSSRVFATAAELAEALGQPWPIRAVTLECQVLRTDRVVEFDLGPVVDALQNIGAQAAPELFDPEQVAQSLADTATLYTEYRHGPFLLRLAISGFDRIAGSDVSIIRAHPSAYEQIFVPTIDLHVVQGPNPSVAASKALLALAERLETQLWISLYA
jgi:hypothetical protein